MDGLPNSLQGLLDAGAYPHPVQAVEVLETHISWILLTGEFAYKIKRPVHYPFLDLRSAERRAFLCHEEIRLNRRFAPEIYLDVCRITSLKGEARMQGAGQTIEHAVKMHQFATDEELDRLLQSARLVTEELEAFGRELARIHAGLPTAQPSQDWGHPATLKEVIRGNLEECARASASFGIRADVRALQVPLEARLEAAGHWMSQRFVTGRVRECHGDLHAQNIVRLGSRLVAFDCLEFEPALRWIDVADEIAFLLADLDARHRPPHAWAFLGGYLTESGDFQACRLLHLYKAHRALVRAKVIALSAVKFAGKTARGTSTTLRQIEEYLNCAWRSLFPKPPVLILMFGLSGSGKTWISERLALRVGAIHLRSDLERKRLMGLREMERSRSDLGEGLYRREISARVYQQLSQCARDILAGGFSAIVDATFNGRADRAQFRDLAADLGVKLWVVHCQAPRTTLRARIIERSLRADDASEGDLSVLRWQESHHEPIQAEEGFNVLKIMTNTSDALDMLVRTMKGMEP